MAKLPKKILQELKDVREAATMRSASFGFPDDTVQVDMHLDAKRTLHPDDFIKGETRNYRETWIIGRLDRVIAWAEGKRTP